MILRRAGAVPRRRGTYAVEFAIVSQVFFFFLFAHITGAWMAFQYQQMAALSREGARWASTHGNDYRTEKDKAAGSAYGTTAIISNTDVYTNAIAPKAVTVQNLTASNVTLSWASTQSSANKDQVKYYDSSTSSFKQNYVTVQVTFTWAALAPFGSWFASSGTMSASSTVAVTY